MEQHPHRSYSLAGFRARHARSVVLAVLFALGGLSAVAFAVAPLAPDAAALPQRLLVEPVPTYGIADQLEALAGYPLDLRRSATSRGPDSVASLLRRMGVLDSAAATELARDRATRQVLGSRGARSVEVRTDGHGRMTELTVRYEAEQADKARTHFSRLVASPYNGHWITRIETVPLTVESRLGSGTIRSSLFAATDEARIPDSVATQLAEIFSSEIDFHRELRKGDTFSVMYEAAMADGEPVPWSQGTGRVLAAEFVNGGDTHQAIWFSAADGKGAYFDGNGRSRKRAFLASPLEFSRVTSGFAMRMHPILQRMRAHQGVDYGAPTGTKVRTVGDGVVGFAGKQNGYGNVIEVHHAGNRSTLYAHLSRIDVKLGQKIEQGDVIGAVGATGWATGPHLHFEFRVAGVHQDPLLVAKAAEQATLDAAARSRFTLVARTALASLDVADSMTYRRGAFE